MTTKIDLDSFVADAMAEMLSKPTAGAVAAPMPTEAVEVKEEVVEEYKVMLAKGEKAFSEVFGVVPKNIRDFAIKTVAEIPEGFEWHVPKIDGEYVVQIEEAARLASALMDGDKVLMTGPTGSGKSSLVKYVCAKIGMPFIRVNMSADIESAALFGQLVVRDGATVWEDGPITEAVRYGACVLVDEWELMPPEISMGLQNLLEDDGYLFLKEMPGAAEDKTIYPHANFRIVCAGNTVGQGDDTGSFSGTMVQNSATLDRFTSTINLSYLDTKHETTIINKRTGVPKKEAGLMVKLAGLIRNANMQQQVNLTMSPRTLINWGNKWSKHGDVAASFRISFYDKLRDSDKKVVGELFQKVFGKACS